MVSGGHAGAGAAALGGRGVTRVKEAADRMAALLAARGVPHSRRAALTWVRVLKYHHGRAAEPTELAAAWIDAGWIKPERVHEAICTAECDDARPAAVEADLIRLGYSIDEIARAKKGARLE